MTIVKKIKIDTAGMYYDWKEYPIVHSSMVPNFVSEFYGTDLKEEFLINCNRLPDNWIYRDLKIFYKFNSKGLRMNKELSEIKDGYIAGFGCSQTLGVGIPLEQTWLHLLSDELKLDYINHGVSGGSIKLCAINFFNMISTLETLPKVAVFSWPSSVRYCFYEDGEFVFYLPRFLTDEKKFEYHTKIYNNMLMTNVLASEALFYRNMIMATCRRLGIKYAEFTFDDRDKELIQDGVPLIFPVDVNHEDLNEEIARDVRDKSDNSFFGHAGRRLHLRAKESIIQQLQ